MSIQIGTPVQFFKAVDGSYMEPMAAVVCGINYDGTANLACWYSTGKPFVATNVPHDPADPEITGDYFQEIGKEKAKKKDKKAAHAEPKNQGEVPEV